MKNPKSVFEQFVNVPDFLQGMELLLNLSEELQSKLFDVYISSEYRNYYCIHSERDEKALRLEAVRAKFDKLLPELLKKYAGQYAAVVDDFVEIHEDKEILLKMVIEKYGYRSIYLGQITREPRVVRMRSPRIKNR